MSINTEARVPPIAPSGGDAVVAAIPFFYGWVMLPIAIVGLIASSPGQTYGISVFTDVLRGDLNLTHSGLSGAYMAGTLLAALPMVFVGTLMDRLGIRVVLAGTVILLGATCLAMSQVTGLITLTLAFVMLRLLGQGALTLCTTNMLSMWFHARLGRVNGLMAIGTALALAAVPPFNQWLIGQYGWRTSYIIFGFLVWALMLPLILIFVRNRPEDVGLLPDGESLESKHSSKSHRVSVPESLSLGQAVRTVTYWILFLMNSAWALIVTAIVFHIVSLFADRGMSSSDTTLFFTSFAISMAATQLFGGVLADRFSLRWLMAISLGGMTLAIAQLTMVQGSASAFLFAITLGGFQGIFLVVAQTVWARYYGRLHLGKIRGTVWTGGVAASAIGPFVMGACRDVWGTFNPALWLFAGTFAALTVASCFARSPQKNLQKTAD